MQKFVHLLKDPVESRRLWLMNILEIPWTIHMKGRWKGAGLQDRWCYKVVMVGPSVNLHMWHCIRKWWLHVVNVSPKKAKKNEADFSPLASLQFPISLSLPLFPQSNNVFRTKGDQRSTLSYRSCSGFSPGFPSWTVLSKEQVYAQRLTG